MEDLLDILEKWIEFARGETWTPEDEEKLSALIGQLPGYAPAYPFPDPIYQAGYAHASGYQD